MFNYQISEFTSILTMQTPFLLPSHFLYFLLYTNITLLSFVEFVCLSLISNFKLCLICCKYKLNDRKKYLKKY